MQSGVRSGMCAVYGVLSWLAVTVCLLAAPVKIIGPTGPVAPYKLVELQAEGDLTGAAVLWDVTPEDAVDMREQPGGKLTFVAPPGTYKVTCTVIRLKDGQTTVSRQRDTITIGAPVPPPVPPVPPPVPPTPPDDALTRSLRAAYTAESDPQKDKQLAFLASLYKGSGTLVDRPDITTNGQLLQALHAAAEAPGLGLTPSQLLKVRGTVADYLDTELGKSSSAPVDKAKVKAVFARLALTLEALR